METIILTQTFPLHWIISLMVVVTTLFFIFRLRLGSMLLSRFTTGFSLTLPMVLIAGVPQAGKTSLFNTLSADSKKAKIFKYGPFKCCRMTTKSGEEFQLIDLPRYVKRKELSLLKPNANLIFFLFDVSPNSLPVETQLGLKKKLEDYFVDATILPILNVKEKIDRRKFKSLKDSLSNDIPLVSVKKKNLKSIENVLALHFS